MEILGVFALSYENWEVVLIGHILVFITDVPKSASVTGSSRSSPVLKNLTIVGVLISDLSLVVRRNQQPSLVSLFLTSLLHAKCIPHCSMISIFKVLCFCLFCFLYSEIRCSFKFSQIFATLVIQC